MILAIALGLIGTVAATALVAWFFGREDAAAGWVIGVGVFLILGLIAVLVPVSIHQQNSWERWCRDQGGHVSDHTEATVVTTVNGNGHVGVGTGAETTYFCLTADGRIIDIQ